MNIRFYNARILTMVEGQEIFEGELWVEDSKITYVGDDYVEFNVIDVDTNFYTTVTVESSNPDLTVTSSYTGAENKTGTKIYNFIYKANEEKYPFIILF